MTSDDTIRAQVIQLITHSNAHMTLDDAIAEFPSDHINTPFPGGAYTPWHLLEHIRLAQLDILDFIRNPHYQERNWPEDYWPPRDQLATWTDWQATITGYLAEREALCALARDPRVDLSAQVPYGNGQTYFREFALVADHTAYHTGEFAIMRQVMGTWGPSHRD